MAAALESAVAALRARPAGGGGAGAGGPDAAAVLARLAAALRHHDTRFLDDYLLALVAHNDADIKTITDELIRKVEDEQWKSEEGGAGGAGAGGPGGAGRVVLAGWLAAAAAWRGPRPPAAPRALLALLRDLAPPQVVEVTRALHAALGARELVAVSDALRGEAARGAGRAEGGQARAWARAGRAGLPALLLRAALAALLRAAPPWPAAALSVPELEATLAPRWNTLDPEAQLVGVGLAARVLAAAAADPDGGADGAGGASGAGPAAARLLAALAHPPPAALRHNPDYLKVTVALGKLQKLLNGVG